MKKTAILLAVLFSSQISWGSSRSSFMPPNDLHLQDRVNSRTANMTEDEFHRIIQHVVDKLKPSVEFHGAELEMNENWFDGTVNAYAEQEGNVWSVAMFGGLARRPEVTPDGFAMVVCHEFGHHLGGFPFYKEGKWAAVEGQSDYFATQVCAKTLWANDLTNNAKFRNTVTPYVKERCDQVYPTIPGQDLCYRAAKAGESLANLLAALGGAGKPQFETPDPSKVGSTREGHPPAQCRLDTYFYGALCDVSFNLSYIPGKEIKSGQNSKQAELDAAQFSCTSLGGSKIGFRPACWFKARF